MRERREYTESFRQQALEKVYTRGSNSIRVVAEDLNMSLGTLRNWMKADRNCMQTKDYFQRSRLVRSFPCYVPRCEVRCRLAKTLLRCNAIGGEY